MYIRQLPKEVSPAGKDYWIPADIGEPSSEDEQNTKRVPLSAFVLKSENPLLTSNEGRVLTPSNFVKANNLVTADGGQLKSIKAGSGLIGEDFNGKEAQEWTVDKNFIQNQISAGKGILKANTNNSAQMSIDEGYVKTLIHDGIFMTATDNGATRKVELTCKIKNGVPVLNLDFVE